MHARLTETLVRPSQPLRRIGSTILLLDEVDSTNAYLLARAANLPDGTVVLAEFQTAGRGRLGRGWESPRGSSVLLSVLLHEPANSPLLPRLTVVAALAGCEAVEIATHCRPCLRWPNDLTLGGRKLGGVLVESAAASVKQRAAVVGVGINCLQQRGHFVGELAHTATSLEIESAHPVDRAAVARHLIERLDCHIAELIAQQAAWPRVLAAWKDRSEDLGGRVSLQHDRRTYTGTVLDISEQGDLLVQLDTGGRRYFASATTTRIK